MARFSRVITDDEINTFVRLYQEGKSIRTICFETNRGYGTVWKYLQEANVVLNKRGGRPPATTES